MATLKAIIPTRQTCGLDTGRSGASQMYLRAFSALSGRSISGGRKSVSPIPALELVFELVEAAADHVPGSKVTRRCCEGSHRNGFYIGDGGRRAKTETELSLVRLREDPVWYNVRSRTVRWINSV
jgi:hypothetical protein